MTPSRRPVAEGTVAAPPSKSITHRAYVLAAHSDAPVVVARPLRAADTDATLACLHRLGHRIQPEDAAVRFLPSTASPPAEPLDCRNAGTALRLLAPMAARLPFPVAFDGDASLRRRPNGPLLRALRDRGARVTGGPTLPFTVQGPLQTGPVALGAKVSSQFASGLLLALAMTPGASQLTMAGPVRSAPYLEVTRQVAGAFGLAWQSQTTGAGGREVDGPADGGPAAAGGVGGGAEGEPPESGPAADGLAFAIPGGQTPRADLFQVEGDWSAAAFPLAAAAITGGKVTVTGLSPDSVQGDRAVLDHLERFGARCRLDEAGATVEGAALESPGTVDVGATPDLFPVLAVVAAAAQGSTRFVGGSQLRHKESDRISAMAEGLTRMGGRVTEHPDGLVVEGGRPLRGAPIQTRGDHRIHMAFQVAALCAEGPCRIDGADAVAVSYPGFHDHLARLTGRAAEVSP